MPRAAYAAEHVRQQSWPRPPLAAYHGKNDVSYLFMDDKDATHLLTRSDR